MTCPDPFPKGRGQRSNERTWFQSNVRCFTNRRRRFRALHNLVLSQRARQAADRPRSVKLVLAAGRACTAARSSAVQSRDRLPNGASQSCLSAILEVGRATASSPRSMHRFRKPGAGALEPPAPWCVWGGRAPICLLSPRGGSVTAWRLRSKLIERRLARRPPGASTERSHRWWRGNDDACPPRGWPRGRVRYSVRPRSPRGNAVCLPGASTTCLRVVGSDAAVARSTGHAPPRGIDATEMQNARGRPVRHQRCLAARTTTRENAAELLFHDARASCS
jgi:hypothetical protein